MGNANTATLGSIFKKNCRVDYVGDPTPQASFGLNRFKGGVSAHAGNCHTQASIFFFFKGSCASLQVGPLDRSSQLTAQTTRFPRDASNVLDPRRISTLSQSNSKVVWLQICFQSTKPGVACIYVYWRMPPVLTQPTD